MWRGGCIIRSAFLGKIKEAYKNNPELENLLLDPYFKSIMENGRPDGVSRRTACISCGKGRIYASPDYFLSGIVLDIFGAPG